MAATQAVSHMRSKSLQELDSSHRPPAQYTREISSPAVLHSEKFNNISEERQVDFDQESLSSSNSEKDVRGKLKDSVDSDTSKDGTRECTLLEREDSLEVEGHSGVFDDHTDSGTEDDIVTRKSSNGDFSHDNQMGEEGCHSDSGVMGASPMETQGPRRLYQSTGQRREKKIVPDTGRKRKSSVPAQFIHRKTSDEIHRKISLGMEYFTLRFDVLDDADIEIVAAVKGVNLRQAISNALEKRNIHLDAIDVYLASSKTPLPKEVDCYPLGGNTLHVRGKDGEHPFSQRLGSTSSLPGSAKTGSNNNNVSRSVEKKQAGMYIKRDQSSRSSPTTAPPSATQGPPIMQRRSVAATRTKSVGSIGKNEAHPLVQVPSIEISEDDESQRGKRNLSGALDDNISLNDVSPAGSLRSGDTTLRTKGAKGTSKLSTLFSPFTKGGEKQEQLSDQLNKYSLDGWPVMPDLLTIGAPRFEDHQFKLEGHWTDIVQSHQELSKCQKDHQEAIWELLHTEVEYIKKVKVIIDLFMSCLYDLQNESIFNEIKTEMVFSNIRDVYQANCELWAHHMLPAVEHSRKTKEPISASMLKEGFLKFENIMQPYAKYCLDFDTCKEYIRKSREKNELFDKFLTWAEGHEQLERLKLQDLIVSPWQRLTKYHLLLKAIKKPIENSEDEKLREDVNEMIEVVEQFGVQVNRVMRQQLEHDRLSSIIERIEAYDAIDTPNEECTKLVSEYTKLESVLTCQLPGCGPQEYRNLLREGSLKLKDTYSRVDVYMFLFTDMLLITKPNKKGDKVKVIKPPMRLDKVMVHTLRDGSSFLLLYLNEYHVASAAYTLHGEGSRSWLEAIKKAQTDYERKRSAFMNRSEGSVLDFTIPENEESDFTMYSTRFFHMRDRSPDTVSRQDSTGSTDTFLPTLAMPRANSFNDDVSEYSHSENSRPRSSTYNDFGRPRSPRGHTHLMLPRHSSIEYYGDDKGSPGRSPPESPGPGSRRDIHCQTHITTIRTDSQAMAGNGGGHSPEPESPSSDKMFFLQQRPDLVYDENLRSKLNQRRVSRGEKRYYTADAIQDLQKDKDSSIHKRLSWNFGTAVDIQYEEKSGVLKGKTFSSDSLRSMPSSSGVSSTGSLHLSPDSEICEEMEEQEGNDTQLHLRGSQSDYGLGHQDSGSMENHVHSPLGDLKEEPETFTNNNRPGKSLDSSKKKNISKSMPDICDIYSKMSISKGEVQDGIASVELPDSDSSGRKKKMSHQQILRMKKQLLLTNSTVEASEV